MNDTTGDYEGMFLVEPTLAAKEWEKVVEEIGRILAKREGQVQSLIKWGERKLAYPIRKSNRGTYVLAYFTAPRKAASKVAIDCQLSEIILRVLVLRQEKGAVRRTEPPKDFETAGLIVPKMDYVPRESRLF